MSSPLNSPEAARARRRILPGVILAAVVAVGVTVAGLVRDHDKDRKPGSVPGATGERIDPLQYRPDLDADYEARATAGYSHVLYAKSPGGVFATARRVDALRPRVEAATRGTEVDPDTLEAVVFLESGGRPDVIAGGKDPANAAGVAQIVAETGQSLLGMHVDLERSRALTRAASKAAARGRPAAARRALAQRRRVDERFDPAKALAGAVRYLTTAQERFGRDDLALVSYHMGIGNLERVISAYGGERPSYVRLFFDSTPLRHAPAWRLLSGFGDDSSTYYWRVLAAQEIMRLYRSDQGTLKRRDELQTNKASSEEVLHPEEETKVFESPDDVSHARDDGSLSALPADPQRLGFHIDPRMGELAPKLDAKPELYRALRPEALRLVEWMGPQVKRISAVPSPLTMTSAVRDQRYQDLLTQQNIEATDAYSLHTTGFAFDVGRRYRGRSQAIAFQFLLDRLQALNLIAWVREPAAIHITASSDAARLP
jgi:transglycosylase-like protein with SLT domain